MLGEKLKDLRTKKDLTQQQVADLLNINRVTYTQYELNRRDPDTATLGHLADFFEVTTDELLGRKPIHSGWITSDYPDPAVAKLLKDNDIKKLEIVRDVTLEELEKALKIIKVMQEEDTKGKGLS